MSYNEIPNILVDSVTLPNKRLSNLEIIDAAKRLSVNGFRGVFLRDTLKELCPSFVVLWVLHDVCEDFLQEFCTYRSRTLRYSLNEWSSCLWVRQALYRWRRVWRGYVIDVSMCAFIQVLIGSDLRVRSLAAGRLSDSAQIEFRGPCLYIVPSDEWVLNDFQQTEQLPVPFAAFCN